MDIIELFQPNLMAFDFSAKSEKELFKIVGEELEALDYVTERYVQGLIDREKKFPTGLITQYLNIALPHGDADNVIKPFVFIARLSDEIVVKQMGDNQEMAVKEFLFLGIADSRKQVGLLATLMELFMNEEFVKRYKNTNKREELKALLDGYLKEGVKYNG